MTENKKGIQVEVFFFKMTENDPRFLLMKRVAEKGGFWQPLTGGVKDETLDEAIIREADEETNITVLEQVYDTGFHFTFTDNNTDYIEYVYGARVPQNTEVKLSKEHTEFKWVTKGEALQLLKWDNNKKGLLALCTMLGY